MHREHDPNKAFPAEIIALEERGNRLPTWYAGPLYTGNGTAEALEDLQRARRDAPANGAREADEDAAF